MKYPGNASSQHSRTYVYRGTVPPLVGVLLAVPVLLAFLSLFAVVLGGGVLAAVLLPFLVRRRRTTRTSADNTIELSPDEYTRIDADTARRHSPRE